MPNKPQLTKNPYPGFKNGVDEAHRYMSFVKKQLKPYEWNPSVIKVIDDMDRAYEARKYRKRIFDTAEELTPDITKEYLYSIYVIYALIDKAQTLLSELSETEE